MKIPLLALYERSLRLEMRSGVPLAVRLMLLGWLLLQLVMIMGQARWGVFGAPGLYFFQHIIWINFVFLTLGGLSYFASAIAEEKEAMTLGLLRMTGLNPLAILLGKSTARLTGAILLLLVQVPFTLLAVTLGGISVLQIVTAYGVLLAYLFLLCNLALIWSVVFQRTATAGAMTALCLLLLLAFPPAGLEILKDMDKVSGLWITICGALQIVCETLVKASPALSLAHVFETGKAPELFSFQVVSNFLAGVFCFGVAWLLFDRCTREQKEAAPVRTLGMRLGSLVRRGRVPPRIVGASALMWKESGLLMGGGLGLALRILGLGLLYGFVACAPLIFGEKHAFSREYVGGSMMVVSIVLFCIGLAGAAAHIFWDETQWKTLSSLMVLPISVRELIYRKMLGRLAGMLPVVGFFVLGAMIYPEGVGDFLAGLFEHAVAVLGLLFGISQFVLFLHLVAFFSLIVKQWALPLTFVIHYVGGSMCLILVALIFGGWGRGGGAEVLAQLGFLFGIGLTIGAVVLVQYGIGKRLCRAAAEE